MTTQHSGDNVAPINPSKIMQVGMGFMASKTLLSAVELGVFSILGDAGKTGLQISEILKLDARAIPDFPDALVALGFLEREGSGLEGVYKNTPETSRFLNRESPAYVGGILEMANARLYGFWNDLSEGLRTGKPQNETKNGGESIFATLYANPQQLEKFMNAMSGISAGNVHALAQTFDFSKYKSLCDVGGANGQLCAVVARAHKHLECTTFDLPPVQPIAQNALEAAGLSGQVKAVSGDFLVNSLPKADVITMSLVLHDWNLEIKKQLIQKAYDALPKGGALVVIESLIDDDRRENVFGLMMSLNMLLEIGDAFDYTFADFSGWCKEIGFTRFEKLPLAGPSSAGIAYK